MGVYVDPLMAHGWRLRGRVVKSCHMFADSLEELHAMAEHIGLKREWFQDERLPHYDLTESRMILALQAGVEQLDRKHAVDIWRRLRKSS